MVKASSMAVRWAAVRVNAVVTEAVASVALGVSVRSRSVKVIDPASLTVPPSVIVPVTSTGVMTGVSLVPVMVIVTSWVASPLLPSSTVIVKIAVTVSPAARKSRSVSRML